VSLCLYYIPKSIDFFQNIQDPQWDHHAIHRQLRVLATLMLLQQVQNFILCPGDTVPTLLLQLHEQLAECNYNILFDILEYTATDHSNECVRGDLVNKDTYGLLREEDQRRLFTEPSPRVPITYACEDEHVKLELLLRNLDM